MLAPVTSAWGTDQSVAVHVDGVYQAHGAMGLSRMFDVERVEVLRGPQGTLYGRNATAGVVNLVSRAPRMKFGAEADVSFGNFGLKQVQGMINVPLGEQTALRLALIASDSTGSATNVFDGSKIGASEDFHGVRGRLRTQLGGFGVDLAIQYINDRSTGFIVPHPELEQVRHRRNHHPMRMAVHPTQDTVTGIYSRSNSRCCITTRNLIYWQLINIIENLLAA